MCQYSMEGRNEERMVAVIPWTVLKETILAILPIIGFGTLNLMYCHHLGLDLLETPPLPPTIITVLDFSG